MKKREFVKSIALGSLAITGGIPLLESCISNVELIKSQNWVWMSWRAQYSEDDWINKFDELASLGFHGIHLQQNDKEKIKKIVPLAKKAGLEIHVWIIVLSQTNEEIRKKHPDWFTISRDGKSSLEAPPYVDYYTWLCPTKEPVVNFITSWAAEMAEIPDLDGVHLDYIRHCDVILPVALWEKYNIIQDKEYAQYDFCYCDDCRSKFKQQSGVDPLDLDDPSSNEEWLQFRYDSVTNLVNKIAIEVHSRNKKLTAAVFPTPDIARQLVRQEWLKWDLDGLFPMIYHSFYNEDVNWIGKATSEGVKALGGKFPLYSGLFVPELTPSELKKAVRISMENGARGITIFEEKSMKRKHRHVVGRLFS